MTDESSATRPRSSAATLLLGAGAGVLASALVAVLLVATGVISLGSGGAGGPGGRDGISEGPGFDTPEAAATAYLEGLRDGDLDAMAGAFAVESFAERCDYAALLDRLQVHTPPTALTSCPFPADDELGAAANVEARRSTVASSVLQPLVSQVSPHLFNEGVAMPLRDETEIGEFQEQTAADFAEYRLGRIEAITTVEPGSLDEVYDSEAHQRILEATAATFGLSTDDYTDVAVTFQLDGEQWVFAPTVGRYDGRWYLVAPSGSLAAILGIPAGTGGLARLGEE